MHKERTFIAQQISDKMFLNRELVVIQRRTVDYEEILRMAKSGLVIIKSPENDQQSNENSYSNKYLENFCNGMKTFESISVEQTNLDCGDCLILADANYVSSCCGPWQEEAKSNLKYTLYTVVM